MWSLTTKFKKKIFMYYSIVAMIATTTSVTTTTGTMAQNSEFIQLQTLIIIVAVTLGCLLLVIICTIIGLACVILSKNKPSRGQRGSDLGRRNSHNSYEERNTIEAKEKGLEKKNQELCASIRPLPPSDPEYATISEWREMKGFSLQSSVTNPFYASTTCVSSSKSNTPEYDIPETVPSRKRGYSIDIHHNSAIKTKSLQDIKSTTLKEGRTQRPIKPTVRAKTLAKFDTRKTHAQIQTKYNARKIASPPLPPPNVTRNLNLLQLAQSNNSISPLMQSIRAREIPAANNSILKIKDNSIENISIKSSSTIT